MNRLFASLITLFISLILINCSNESSSPSVVQSKVQDKKSTSISYKVIETFDVGSNIYVRSLGYDKNAKTVWVGTSVGVLEVDAVNYKMLNTYTRDNGMANEYVFSIMVDSNAGKWMGTNGGGVSHLKDNQWTTYFPMHGLADYWVYSFAEQSNGNIWIGTWAGLNDFDPKTKKFKTYFDELVNEWIYGLAVDSKNRVWVGTEGGVNMFDGSQWQTWTHKDGLGAANMHNLPSSPNTGLGTRDRHDLNILQEGRETYNPNYVFTLIAARDDTIWAGTWGAGVSHFDGQKWTNYTTQDGLAGNIVYSIGEANDGSMWFGTNQGLTHFDSQHWETLGSEQGLDSTNIYAISVTPDDTIWVGTHGKVRLIALQEQN